ncbi:Tat pathway signal sequence domain protein [Streptomyces graminofaciens]|uniref:Tat pathway signal sequence domain protein n=1 Tax=Streptomyces graminofaciens TaxID=68212 RepID=UPI002573BD88|nr:Tat pathway signal sequence domain protein [Streptomyces graminofaciens]
MSHAPRRREVLKYAGTTGVAAAGLGLLTSQPAAAAPVTESDDSAAFKKAVCKPLDIVVFGDAESEAEHGLTATLSDMVTGGLGQSARVLNPTAPASYWGGTLKFDVAVSPTDTTYVTVRLWGDDHDDTSEQAGSGTNMWRLQLFVDGRQVGYQDEGAVDSLDILDTAPRTPGRFFFHTLPLPESMTSGKEKVTLEIRAMGRIWSYGQNPDQLYRKQTTPSRGIYRIYTHTEPYFVPPKGEVQGPAPEFRPRTVEGPEVLEAVRKRVEKDQKFYLTSANPAGMDAFAFQSLAEGYLWSGSPAHQNPAALDRVLRAIDGRYMAWKSDASILTGSDQQWQGFGRVGLTLALLWEHLGDRLDQRVTGSPYEITNPGFEEGDETPMGWLAPSWGQTAGATWSRDTAVHRAGSASLKLQVPAAGGNMYTYSSPKTRIGKGTYTYGAWIRTEGVTGAGAHIDPLFFDASGTLVGSDHKKFATTGTHGWEYVSIDLETPSGATQVEFHLRLSGPGTAWFDSVELIGPAEIRNPGFEQGPGTVPTGWTVPSWGRTADATWSRVTDVSRSGTASLKLAATASNGFVTAHNTARFQVGEGTYAYSAWIRTDGVTGTGAHIDPLFFDANGKLVGSDHRKFAATGTHDWEQVSIDLETPSGATQVEFHLRLSGPGTAWFDDLTVTAPKSSGAPEQPVRRAAYTDMLKSSRDYWRQHFPHYTNQSQICAIGLYQANRGLRLLDPDLALPEDKARDYMYQSLGMKPYLGREDKDGNPTKPLGETYHQVTKAGLTRELGYVGSYGEVIDWLVMMYESVTRGHDAQEAPELREQMVKIIKARGRFRVVDVDETGARVSRIETVIGWRNEVYPGEIAYASRTAWDSHPVMSAAVFKDPDIVGWTQEMVDDGQFYRQLDLLINHTWTRVGLAALRLVSRDWDAFQALANRPARIPTAWEQPDFVFADEENGCLAVKNGEELLFASLYWRSRQGVNNYARIHHLTPVDQRSATVRERSAGTTDETFTARDWILWDYAINDPGAGHLPPGGFPPPGDTLHQSQEGDVYHLAPIPDDIPDPTLGVHFDGVETMLVGRAPFYLCEYGDYLIAMNTSTDRTFTLPARQQFGPARDLATGRTIGAGQRPKLGPLSTLVLHRSR